MVQQQKDNQTDLSQKGTAPKSSLTWDEFLGLRIRRRRINAISSAATGISGILIGWAAISNIEIDPTQMIFGFDPLSVYAVGLVLCGGVGALAGPTLGGAVFEFMLGKNFKVFSKKNSEFLQHIKRNRPDPTNQSYGNPVTDYYGEKIGSLKEYRRWLRDGRAYRKKLENFL